MRKSRPAFTTLCSLLAKTICWTWILQWLCCSLIKPPNPIWESVNLKLGCYYLLVGLSLQYCCEATRPLGMPSTDLTASLLGKALGLSQLKIHLQCIRSSGLHRGCEQALCYYPKSPSSFCKRSQTLIQLSPSADSPPLSSSFPDPPSHANSLLFREKWKG